jgi:hypothetical protein
MAYDCIAAQAELDALKAAYMAKLTGKMIAGATYGDTATTFAATSTAALKEAIAEKQNEMFAAGCALTSGKTAMPRIAQPSLGSGRY